MGTVAMGSNVASILQDRGGATVGDCQIRLAGCPSLAGAGSAVVRVLWTEDGRAIRVCPMCRDAQVKAGLWTLQQRPRVAWLGSSDL